MLRNDFNTSKEIYKHSRINARTLEKELKRAIEVLKLREQELQEKQALIAAHQRDMSKTFSASARTSTVTADAVFHQFGPFGGSGSEHMSEAIFELIDPAGVTSVSADMDMSALVSALADARDNSVSKNTTTAQLKRYINQDVFEQARQKGKPLAPTNTIEGIHQRVDMLQERLEQVQFAQHQRIDVIQLNSRGINIPEGVLKGMEIAGKTTGYTRVSPKAASGIGVA